MAKRKFHFQFEQDLKQVKNDYCRDQEAKVQNNIGSTFRACHQSSPVTRIIPFKARVPERVIMIKHVIGRGSLK